MESFDGLKFRAKVSRYSVFIVLLTMLEYTFSLFHTCSFNCSMLRAGFLNMDAGGSYIAVA